jgi:hypothetical protein
LAASLRKCCNSAVTALTSSPYKLSASTERLRQIIAGAPQRACPVWIFAANRNPAGAHCRRSRLLHAWKYPPSARCAAQYEPVADPCRRRCSRRPLQPSRCHEMLAQCGGTCHSESPCKGPWVQSAGCLPCCALCPTPAAATCKRLLAPLRCAVKSVMLRRAAVAATPSAICATPRRAASRCAQHQVKRLPACSGLRSLEPAATVPGPRLLVVLMHLDRAHATAMLCRSGLPPFLGRAVRPAATRTTCLPLIHVPCCCELLQSQCVKHPSVALLCNAPRCCERDTLQRRRAACCVLWLSSALWLLLSYAPCSCEMLRRAALHSAMQQSCYALPATRLPASVPPVAAMLCAPAPPHFRWPQSPVTFAPAPLIRRQRKRTEGAPCKRDDARR